MRYEELEAELLALGTSLSEETMTVTIDGRDINLMLNAAGTYLYAYAAVREIDAEIDRSSLRSLLALNTMGKKTEGGHLGLIEGSDALLYSKRFAVETLATGELQGKLLDVATNLSRISENVDWILQTAVVETKVPEEPHYDALSVTSAISFGWIQV